MRIQTKWFHFLLMTGIVACGGKHHSSAVSEEPKRVEEDAGLTDSDADDDDGPVAQPTVREAEDAENDATANFRGFLQINEILSQRLIARGDTSFFFGNYLDSYYRTDAFGLAQLLGYEVGDGVRSGFRNGKANAINMVLWHSSMTSLATQVGEVCAQDLPVTATALPLKEDVLSAIRPLCAWPAPEARTTEVLARLWRLVMAYDAPETEFTAFSQFFQGPVYARSQGPDAVQAMMTAMLYNPHFLVRK